MTCCINGGSSGWFRDGGGWQELRSECELEKDFHDSKKKWDLESPYTRGFGGKKRQKWLFSRSLTQNEQGLKKKSQIDPFARRPPPRRRGSVARRPTPRRHAIFQRGSTGPHVLCMAPLLMAPCF
jgi:hypothetical protein